MNILCVLLPFSVLISNAFGINPFCQNSSYEMSLDCFPAGLVSNVTACTPFSYDTTNMFWDSTSFTPLNCTPNSNSVNRYFGCFQSRFVMSEYSLGSDNATFSCVDSKTIRSNCSLISSCPADMLVNYMVATLNSTSFDLKYSCCMYEPLLNTYTVTPFDRYFYLNITEPTILKVVAYSQVNEIESMLWLYNSSYALIQQSDYISGSDSSIMKYLDTGAYFLNAGVYSYNQNQSFWNGTNYMISANVPMALTTIPSSSSTTTFDTLTFSSTAYTTTISFSYISTVTDPSSLSSTASSSMVSPTTTLSSTAGPTSLATTAGTLVTSIITSNSGSNSSAYFTNYTSIPTGGGRRYNLQALLSTLIFII
jgi:hypothetical protein